MGNKNSGRRDHSKGLPAGRKKGVCKNEIASHQIKVTRTTKENLKKLNLGSYNKTIEILLKNYKGEGNEKDV